MMHQDIMSTDILIPCLHMTSKLYSLCHENGTAKKSKCSVSCIVYLCQFELHRDEDVLGESRKMELKG